jgi:hypothetical protein
MLYLYTTVALNQLVYSIWTNVMNELRSHAFFNLFLYHMCAEILELLTSQGSGHHRYIIALDERLRQTASPSESLEWWLSVDRVGFEQL